jgi:peptidoglycan/LPS O-acetylase OafA/YrhL
LVRLWIVLLPALLLGAIWDHIGIYLHYAPNLYSGADYNHMTPDVTRALSLVDFLGNVAFVQTIAVPTFGSNGALWSLANEFWYYALFPLAACVVARVAKTRTHIVLCIAAFAVIATGITKEILLAFPVWLVGALLHAVPSRIPAAVWFRALAAVSYTAFFFGMSALDHMGWIGQGILGDSLLGLGTFGFIWVLLSAKEQADKTMLNQFVRKTASFSYTLYLAHTPILIFTVALLARDTRWFPDTGVAALAICVLILVVAYAWLLATVTEFKTDKVRSWAERTLIRRSADAGVT